MARLVTVKSVRERAVLPNMDVINKAIGDVLDGATEELESLLRMEFDQQVGIEDTFYVGDSNILGFRHANEFLLSQGLVDESSNTIQVVVAGTFQALEAGDTTDLRSPNANEFVVLKSAAKGLVLVQDYDLDRLYVRITYDAGLDVNPNKTEEFLQSGTASVPTWLQDLARLWAMAELETHPDLLGSRSVPDEIVAARFASLKKRLDQLLDRHQRYEPQALKPI
jgi:hypothetical protein